MMTRILVTAALSITAMTLLVQAEASGAPAARNGVALKGLKSGNSRALKAQAENGLKPTNALALDMPTDPAAAERRVHAGGFAVTSVILRDGTVIGR